MMRISLDSPALIAVRGLLAGSTERPTPRDRRGRRASRAGFTVERLEPRTMMDAAVRAALPDLVAASDTGISNSDDLTADRTPVLTGSVSGPVSQVRLFIDGRRGDLAPVTNGTWTYEVPATAALTAGRHTIAVRPIDTSGRVGKLSPSLPVTIVTAPPAAPTQIGLAAASDSGAKGDGRTFVSAPTIRGRAPADQFVNVTIDGEFVGRARSDAQGAWSLKAPQLANGDHEVTAVAENRAGLTSAATRFALRTDGERRVMLDASNKQTVELMASHLLGRGSQGFVVTQVHRGVLQRWSAAQNAWVAIPAGPLVMYGDPLQTPPANRRLGFNEAVRWTPGRRDVGMGPAFSIRPLDMAGGLTAPTPEAATVPGKVKDGRIRWDDGAANRITWAAPTDGCGCASTRYSVEVTREDGQTLLYNVPSKVRAVSSVEGGDALRARIWGATRTGAGLPATYDASAVADSVQRFDYTVTSAASYNSLEKVARAQTAASPTGVGYAKALPVGATNAKLAYLEVKALPDNDESAQGLPAGTPMIVSSDSNQLTPKQKADLAANPIYASHLFPGTVNGRVQPDQVRLHFQAGEMLQFAGTVDASVRAGATIVVEQAQILGDGSRGPWFEKIRLPVGADGSYSVNHVVQYGQNSLRVRLEHPKRPAAAAGSVGATSSTSAPISTAIDLSGSYNAFGITTAPWQVPNSQGFDRNGNYYNSDYTGSATSTPYLGTTIAYNGISFPLGPIPTAASQVGGGGNTATNNPLNFVQATGQTINVTVDADKSDYLYLAGAASNGNQLSQVITLKFTDGTTEEWTQSFHDWASGGTPQSDAQTSSSNPKAPVRVATTASITLSGLQTIDGVALAAGDRVLVKNQTYEQKNGIYVAAAGAWSRAKDAEVSSGNWVSIENATTTVLQGTTNGGKYFIENSDPYSSDGDITFIETAAPVPAPRPFAGELLLKTEPERINQLGNLVTTPAHIFAYCRNLHGKQLASITLPNNANVGILSAVVAKAPVIAVDEGVASFVLGTTNLTGTDLMALTIKNESNIGAGGGPLTFFFADQPVKGSVATASQPATYATKQVTVPMGQQTTIAYVAPDSSSQMNFYVQKPETDCVGANCSTYLTDWNDGSGSSTQFASNISPSLNAQMKAGQHWTMTIQNAGLGYNGYLYSPSARGLPLGSSNTPAGAQFKLMTQAEINSQPAWAVAIEEALGEAVAIVGLSILTGGAIDYFFFADETADEAVAAGKKVLKASFTATGADGSSFTEKILTDSWFEDMGDLRTKDLLNDYLNFDPDRPVIEEVDEVPFANRGLRQDPDVVRVNKAIQNAFTNFGFR